MKRNELQKCVGCGNGMMHSNCPVFFRVRVERMVVNLPAVQRRHGLELMLAGNTAFADALGPNEDMAIALDKPKTFLVCIDCSIRLNISELTVEQKEAA